MMYALVENDTIVDGTVGALPDVWNDGTRDWDLRPMDAAQLSELGWYEVVTTERPPDTDTTTHDYSVDLVGGTPTEVWTERPKTPDEVASAEASANTTQMVAESDEAVDKLVLVVENLNLITALTNAEINANPAAIIKDLARECKTIARQANREARLTSGRTEDTFTGTEEPL